MNDGAWNRWFIWGAGVAVLVIAVAITAYGSTRTWDNISATIELGRWDEITQPVVTPAGRVLLARSKGSSVEIVEVLPWPARTIGRGRFSAGGHVTNLALATSPAGQAENRSLLLIRSCTGRRAVVNEEGGKECPVLPRSFVSLELDSRGRIEEGPIQVPGEACCLPVPAPDGFLLAGPEDPWVYREGRWERSTAPEEPPALPGRRVSGGCATATDRWVLYESLLLPTMTSDGKFPDDYRHLALWSAPLNGNSGDWGPVAFPPLDHATSAGMTCGETIAFVEAGGAVYSTAEPGRPLEGLEDDVMGFDSLRGNVPTALVFVREERVVGPAAIRDPPPERPLLARPGRCFVLRDQGPPLDRGARSNPHATCQAPVCRNGGYITVELQYDYYSSWKNPARVVIDQWSRQ